MTQIQVPQDRRCMLRPQEKVPVPIEQLGKQMQETMSSHCMSPKCAETKRLVGWKLVAP